MCIPFPPALVIGVCAVCGCLRAAGRDLQRHDDKIYIGNKEKPSAVAAGHGSDH